MDYLTNRDCGDEHAAVVTRSDRDGHEHRIVHRYPGSSEQYTATYFYQHGDAGTGARADERADDDRGTARPARA